MFLTRALPRVITVVLGMAATICAGAVDIHSNLAPLEVQDANPSDRGSRSLDLRTRFERTDDGKNEWLLRPQVKFGLGNDMQLDLGTSVIGGQTREGSGDASARLLYRLRAEGRETGAPAVALSLRADFPSGNGSAGVDTEVRFILSRKLSEKGKGHANLAWLHDAAARPGNREQRYGLIVGYAHALSERTNLISDLVVRQQQSVGKGEGIAEFGVRHMPVKDLVLGAGLGVGLSTDAPRYRILLSLQQGF